MPVTCLLLAALCQAKFQTSPRPGQGQYRWQVSNLLLKALELPSPDAKSEHWAAMCMPINFNDEQIMGMRDYFDIAVMKLSVAIRAQNQAIRFHIKTTPRKTIKVMDFTVIRAIGFPEGKTAYLTGGTAPCL